MAKISPGLIRVLYFVCGVFLGVLGPFIAIFLGQAGANPLAGIFATQILVGLISPWALLGELVAWIAVFIGPEVGGFFLMLFFGIVGGGLGVTLRFLISRLRESRAR